MRSEMKEETAFRNGDIVFAKEPGYIFWPACLLEYDEKQKAWNVQFLVTNDRLAVKPKHLCLFETHRERFINDQNITIPHFQKALLIAEKLLEAFNMSSEPIGPRLVVKNPIATGACTTSPALTKKQELVLELNFVSVLQKQRETLEYEKDFVSLINYIRTNLICTSTNVPAALEALELLVALPLSQYMLVRNFECVKTIHQLLNYVGNILHKPPNSEELRELACQAALVRLRAHNLYDYFKSLFPVHYSHYNFWLEYCNQQSVYRKYTIPSTVE